MTTNDEVLNSWKEVATYMGRGVRTVQRWEQELGLPVRRPRGKSRSAVIAFKSELDQWLHRAPSELPQPEAAQKSEAVPQPEAAPQPEAVQKLTPIRRTHRFTKDEAQTKLHDNTAILVGRTQLLLSRSHSLCERIKDLRQQIERTMHLANLNVERNARYFRVDGIRKPVSAVAVALKAPEARLRKNHALAS
jgi:hypothetical protein